MTYDDDRRHSSDSLVILSSSLRGIRTTPQILIVFSLLTAIQRCTVLGDTLKISANSLIVKKCWASSLRMAYIPPRRAFPTRKSTLDRNRNAGICVAIPGNALFGRTIWAHLSGESCGRRRSDQRIVLLGHVVDPAVKKHFFERSRAHPKKLRKHSERAQRQPLFGQRIHAVRPYRDLLRRSVMRVASFRLIPIPCRRAPSSTESRRSNSSDENNLNGATRFDG